RPPAAGPPGRYGCFAFPDNPSMTCSFRTLYSRFQPQLLALRSARPGPRDRPHTGDAGPPPRPRPPRPPPADPGRCPSPAPARRQRRRRQAPGPPSWSIRSRRYSTVSSPGPLTIPAALKQPCRVPSAEAPLSPMIVVTDDVVDQGVVQDPEVGEGVDDPADVVVGVLQEPGIDLPLPDPGDRLVGQVRHQV